VEPNPVLRHPDDLQNPLSMSYPDSGLSGIYIPRDVDQGDLWTGMFGSFLPCVAQGEGPIEITGVRWEDEAATEPVSVETYVRTFDTTVDMPIGTALGTPESPSQGGRFDNSDLRKGVEGLEVTQPCPKDGESRADGVLDEVLFVVTSGPSGAKLESISFTYTAPGGKQYEVVNDWKFYLCGSEIPDELRCT
jgi:hypothetical protein